MSRASQLLDTAKVFEAEREFGRTWHEAVPRYAIKRHMGSVHVGTPDSEVHAMIDQAIGKQKARSTKIAGQWTPEIEKQTHDYAIAAHRQNQRLYGAVMSGQLGGKRMQRRPKETAMGAMARAGRL